jgi:hypothetical protein
MGRLLRSALLAALLPADAALAQYVQQDGTTPLTAPWNAGPFAISSGNSIDAVNPVAYGADPTGTIDSRNAIQTALDFAQGRPVVLPAGRFVLQESLVFTPPQTVPLGPGIILRGSGRYATVLDNRVADGNALTIRAVPSAFGAVRFQSGGEVSDIGIITTTRPPRSNGVYIRGAWQMYFRNVRVMGLTGDGIVAESLQGDPDAPINVVFENSFFWNNDGYGLRITNAPGVSNITFVSVRDCSIQANLTGGIFWNGQHLHLYNNGIAANGNPASPSASRGGIYVNVNAASSQSMSVIGTTFENNVPRHLHVEALYSGFFAANIFRSSMIEFPTNNSILLGGTPPNGPIVTNLTFQNNSAIVDPRLTPHVFFRIESQALRTTIAQMRWQRYDAPGQVRYVDNGAESRLSDTVLYNLQAPQAIPLVTGLNSDVVIGEEYGLVRLAAPGPAWIGGFTGGRNGKILMVLNASGRDITFLHEHPSSAAPNRIWLKNGGAVVTNHLGSAWFIYDDPNKRWWLMGVR